MGIKMIIFLCFELGHLATSIRIGWIFSKLVYEENILLMKTVIVGRKQLNIKLFNLRNRLF